MEGEKGREEGRGGGLRTSYRGIGAHATQIGKFKFIYTKC